MGVVTVTEEKARVSDGGRREAVSKVGGTLDDQSVKFFLIKSSANTGGRAETLVP